ncbi:protein starmaker-like isoform X2 [Phycodurus eques]|uniref:protein starmaker-like isoform X2 n=1 Tax=Phycodurus eques TaxID=693459 RepID=UPI002ACE9A7E|nr:protein starmaker-like isoform X2 [Phycodurus eques]
MAGSEEDLLSPGHLNGTNVNTFNIYRNLSGTIHQRSRMMRLQQRCQELKNRESAARHHNQQLLQQFNRAQDTLREMMATTAAMKTIRMEYEPFLEESSPYRQKQLKEKAQIHHRKRMEEYLKMSTTSVGKPLYSHSCSRQTQRDAATQAYDGQGGSYPPYMECLSSHSYSDRTIAASIFPPTLLPCPQSFQLQHLIATPSHPQCRPSQNTPGCTPSQAKSPRSSVVSDAEDTEISSSSRRKSSHLSQELDFKPVRLSSHHVENGDSSSTESRQVKSKKRRKTNTSSDRDRSSSKESSRSSSAAVAQTSESEASSHQGSTSRRMRRNIGGLVPGLPLTTKSETEDKERRGSRSVSESQTEDTASQSPSNQSESSSGDNSPSQSEESSGGSDMAVKGKDNEKLEEEVDSKSDGNEEESNMEEDNEDEETSPEDEREHKSDVDQGCDDISDKLDKKTALALLQDEHKDEDERDDDDVEEEEDESDAEEQKSEAEERDADDIISPQQRKPRVHFIPQEGSEDDGKVVSRTGTSKDSSELGDDDIEDLLAPQPQANIRRNGHEAVEEPKVVCKVEIFQADQQTDSDEFDHFYD